MYQVRITLTDVEARPRLSTTQLRQNFKTDEEARKFRADRIARDLKYGSRIYCENFSTLDEENKILIEYKIERMPS
jgi:hypothetical protein